MHGFIGWMSHEQAMELALILSPLVRWTTRPRHHHQQAPVVRAGFLKGTTNTVKTRNKENKL